MAKKIIPLIPSHVTYVEPFAGMASVLLSHPPSPVEVFNDLDSDVVNLFRVLRDRESFDEFHRMIRYTPVGREEFYTSRKLLDDPNHPAGGVQRAYRFYLSLAWAMGSNFKKGGWRHVVTSHKRGMAENNSKWLSMIDHFPEIYYRLMKVQIEHRPASECIKLYDTTNTFFYLDPPYVPSTRRDGKYKHEMSAEDHEDMVKLLLGLQGKAILSGYKHEIYLPLEAAGWQRRDYSMPCSVAGRTKQSGLLGKGIIKEKQMRTESLWLCPRTVAELKETKMEAYLWE